MLPFKILRPLLWDEVFAIWRDREQQQPHWQKAFKETNFSSWEAWRRRYATDLGLPEKVWTLYELRDVRGVLDLLGGPFKSWVEQVYPGASSRRIEDLAASPCIQQRLADFEERRKGLPEEVTFIALNVRGQFVLVEGMHTAISIALELASGKSVDTKVCVALAAHQDYDPPVVGSYRLSS